MADEDWRADYDAASPELKKLSLPTWRVHRDGLRMWTICENKRCPEIHQQYNPFKGVTT